MRRRYPTRRMRRSPVGGACVYRAIEWFGQVIDVLVAQKRNLAATRRFFTRALGQASRPADVTTDRAPAYPRVPDEPLPAACHVLENTRIIPSHPIMAG